MASAEVLGRRNIHLKGLQRIYFDVLEVIEDIPHVALYDYSSAKWNKMDIEGSAYITRNNSSPYYSFIIMNKKGVDDLLLHIVPMIEKVKLQEEYLMLKCSPSPENGNQSKILGVWIHDDEVRKTAKESIERILKASVKAPEDILQKLSSIKSYAAVAAGNTETKVEAKSIPSQISPVTASTTASTTIPTNISDSVKIPAPENKSIQLLSLLKKPAGDIAKKTDNSDVVSSGLSSVSTAPPTSNGGAALLSLLKSSAQPPITSTASTSRTESSSNTTSPSGQKAEQLLSVLSFNSSTSRNSSPPMADLLTDGDIAKAVKENQKGFSATSTPINRSRGNSGSDLLALLTEPPKAIAIPVKPPAPIASALPNNSSKAVPLKLANEKADDGLTRFEKVSSPVLRALSTNSTSTGSTKKPVVLISPSDLDD